MADRLGREERVEGARHDIRGHTCAGVGDEQTHVFSGGHLPRRLALGYPAPVGENAVRGLDQQMAPVGHRIARVDDQIEERVLELVRVAQGWP